MHLALGLIQIQHHHHIQWHHYLLQIISIKDLDLIDYHHHLTYWRSLIRLEVVGILLKLQGEKMPLGSVVVGIYQTFGINWRSEQR